MEEFDYMSDEFLKGEASSDVRPGLMRSHKQQRDHELLKKKRELDEKNKKQNLPQSVLQAESREKGLQQPISCDNKGFSMLEKMGFKPGTGLGKSSSGIVEPVGIQMKNDRMGLGRAEALKQIRIKKRNIMLKHMQQSTNVDEFRNLQSKKRKERETLSDLRKSQRVCHQLDVTSDVKSPAEDWFWPEEMLPEKNEGDGEDSGEKEEVDSDEDGDEIKDIEYEPQEKLEILTGYLRQTFLYCIWCGVQFDDEKDMQACPGATRDDH